MRIRKIQQLRSVLIIIFIFTLSIYFANSTALNLANGSSNMTINTGTNSSNEHCDPDFYFSENGQKCMPIPSCDPGKEFDKDREICIKLGEVLPCDPDHYFSKSKGECLPIATCPNNQVFDQERETCSGGPQLCKQGEYFSQTQNRCVVIPTCPNNQVFDQERETCPVITTQKGNFTTTTSITTYERDGKVITITITNTTSITQK